MLASPLFLQKLSEINGDLSVLDIELVMIGCLVFGAWEFPNIGYFKNGFGGNRLKQIEIHSERKVGTHNEHCN